MEETTATAGAQPFLGDDWFDPLETAVRDRLRGVTPVGLRPPACHPENGTPQRQPAETPLIQKRNLSRQSRPALFTAATAMAAGQNSTSFTAAAKAVAAQYSFTDGSEGASVVVNNPPKSGSYKGVASAVEVIVTQPQQMLFSRIFLASAPVIGTRAVAKAGASGTGCVMALDRGNVTDVADVGNSTLNLSGCSLYVNSPSSSALTLTGGAVISAYSAYIVGNYTASSNSQFNTSHGVNTGVSAADDPYANTTIPSYSGCNKTSLSVTGSTTVNLAPSSPGGVFVACQGIDVQSQGTLNLSPGIYVMDAGNFKVAGGATVTGHNVTIILTSSSGSNWGNVQISGGANVNLSAPSSGATAGIAFYEDRNYPFVNSNNTNNFAGGTIQNINGAIYIPSQSVTYTGGSSGNGAAACTQLIAFKLNFNGTSYFNSNCTGTGVQGIGTSLTALVE